MPHHCVSSYLLPYQIAWLNDTSRFKIWEKSRRIGATYVQALEDVLDCASYQYGVDVWFASADVSAGREYMRYCYFWASILQKVGAQYHYNIIQESTNNMLTFSNNKRICCLSSNAKNFRSKGGKIIIDEFAFHDDQEQLWKAASPSATWGFPIRILSTYNGCKNRYYRMVNEARHGNNSWSLHSTTIYDALSQGLLCKIYNRPTTQDDEHSFIASCVAQSGDEAIFQQEFNCNPVDGTTAWIKWDAINQAVNPHNARPIPAKGTIYIGMDIGRRHDLTVLCVIEHHNDILYMHHIERLKTQNFAAQHDSLNYFISRYNPLYVAIDQTGIGEQFIEYAINEHGSNLVKGVIFTNKIKHKLAHLVRDYIDRKQLYILDDDALKKAMHAIERSITPHGNICFNASRNAKGHADEFWALALSLYAYQYGVKDHASRLDEHVHINTILDADL